jgi:hypothetical protein
MLKLNKLILLNSKLSWRTFWLILLIRTGINAQYVGNSYDPYGNRPGYPPWNQQPPPQPYNPNYPPPYDVVPPPRNNFETFPDTRPYQQPGYSDSREIDDRIFSTVHEYEVISTKRPFTGQPEKDTPLYGGIIDGPMSLERSKSPYLAREDVIIGPKGVMVIEAGVVVKFAPMTGLTIRGVLDIQVSVCLFI